MAATVRNIVMLVVANVPCDYHDTLTTGTEFVSKAVRDWGDIVVGDGIVFVWYTL